VLDDAHRQLELLRRRLERAERVFVAGWLLLDGVQVCFRSRDQLRDGGLHVLGLDAVEWDLE
jgi:hypothetical protein